MVYFRALTSLNNQECQGAFWKWDSCNVVLRKQAVWCPSAIVWFWHVSKFPSWVGRSLLNSDFSCNSVISVLFHIDTVSSLPRPLSAMMTYLFLKVETFFFWYTIVYICVLYLIEINWEIERGKGDRKGGRKKDNCFTDHGASSLQVRSGGSLHMVTCAFSQVCHLLAPC